MKTNTLQRQLGRLDVDTRVTFLAGQPHTIQRVAALPLPGRLVFVRHGESVANELNVFAGTDDVPLTAFGRAQAGVAAARLATLGVRFDEVHTSRLGRAKETARIIAAGTPGCFPAGVRWTTGAALDERDFGAFTGRNKNLAARAVGFAEFEAMLHDPARRPPVGESTSTLHARVKHYYETVLEPAQRAGRNVLVVAHKYVLEVMVLVAAGHAPGGCFDMKLPNSMPIEFHELVRFAGGARRGMQKAGDFVTAHCVELAAFAAIAGVALRFAIGAALPGGLYLDAMLGLLAAAALLGSLDVNIRHAIREYGTRYVVGLAVAWLPRIAVGGAMLCLGGPVWGLVGALLVTPPATAASVLARLWGGEGRRAGLETVLASMLVPAAAAGAAALGCMPGGVSLDALVAAAVLIVGATLAGQVIRAKAKTVAPAFALRFGWLGPVALACMAALGAYQLAPVGQALTVEGFLVPLVAFVAARYVLGALSRLANRRASATEQRDACIAQQTPNVFLWVTLAGAADTATGFACLAAFLACLVADNWRHVEQERSALLAALPTPQPAAA